MSYRISATVLAFFVLLCTQARGEADPADVHAAETPYSARRIEVAIGGWYPGPNLTLSANDRGISGTAIDLRGDLRMSSRWLPDVQARVRIARRHSFRFEYLPIANDERAVLPRDVTYRGQVFRAGELVTSTLDWRVYRFGYEYDVVDRPTVTAGLSVEARQSDLRLGLAGPLADTLGRSRIPMPVVGGLVRLNATPRLAFTGEAAAFAVPDNAARTFGGHFIDAAGYAIVSLTRQLAARGGLRTIDIRHFGDHDRGRGRLTGLYVGAVFTP